MGGMYKDFISVFEVLNFDIEESKGVQDKGSVFTLENKWRFYRENYVMLHYEQGNTTRSRKKGDTVRYSVGLKSYIVSGTKVELAYVNTKETAITGNAGTTNVNAIQFQGHIYF